MFTKQEIGANGFLGFLGDLYTSPYSTVLSIGLVFISAAQAQLLTMLESCKIRFPAAADHIDFAVQKASVVSSTIYHMIFRSCEKVKDTANDLKSHATDKAYVIRQKISNVETKVKEEVSGAKGAMSSYFDKIILASSDFLLRAPATLEPVVIKALERGRPYVLQAVSIAKPYVMQVMVASGPFLERIKPSLQLYLEKLKTVISSYPFWAENMDIAAIKITQALPVVSAYCGVDKFFEEEGRSSGGPESATYYSADNSSSDDKDNEPKHIWVDTNPAAKPTAASPPPPPLPVSFD